jgi:hypothetical protein
MEDIYNMKMTIFWDVAVYSLSHHPDDGGSKHRWNVCQCVWDYRLNIPGDNHLRICCHENLKSHIFIINISKINSGRMKSMKMRPVLEKLTSLNGFWYLGRVSLHRVIERAELFEKPWTILVEDRHISTRTWVRFSFNFQLQLLQQVANMFHVLFYWTWSQVRWMQFVLVHMVSCSAQITSCLGKVGQVITGPRAIIQKVPNLWMPCWTLSGRNARIATVFRASSSRTLWVEALALEWEHSSSQKLGKNTRIGLWTLTLSCHRQRCVWGPYIAYRAVAGTWCFNIWSCCSICVIEVDWLCGIWR